MNERMVMTLDEAIKHCEEVMMENLEKTKDRNASDPIAINCFECADEHRQLAEWLKELKTSRECIERIRIACLCPGLRGDGFEEEVVEAMNDREQEGIDQAEQRCRRRRNEANFYNMRS